MCGTPRWNHEALSRSSSCLLTFPNWFLKMVILICNIPGHTRHLFHHVLTRKWPWFLFCFESPWLVTYDFENKDLFSSSVPSPRAAWFSQKTWHIKPVNISSLSLPRKWLQDKNKYSLCSIYPVRTEQGFIATQQISKPHSGRIPFSIYVNLIKPPTGLLTRRTAFSKYAC